MRVEPQLNRSMAALANDFQQVAGVRAADEVAMRTLSFEGVGQEETIGVGPQLNPQFK